MSIPILGRPEFAAGQIVQHRDGTMMGIVAVGPKGEIICQIVQTVQVHPDDIRLWVPTEEERKALEEKFGGGAKPSGLIQ